jgi:nicotinate-nucleotide adenylyltransferase
MRIGLFGGSFNPPHAAHLMVAKIALRRLGLQRIWVLVTPGNPLKDNRDLPELARRVAAVKALVKDPRIVVTDIEARFGTFYSVDTLRKLLPRGRGARFVWIMGGDGLASFHRWGGWREIARRIPIAIVDRPGATLKALRAPAAVALGRHRLDETDGRLLPFARAPAWIYIHDRRSGLSSTQLRALARPAHRNH